MKRVKTFKFKRNGVVDLTDTPECGCNVIQCGKDKFSIREFRVIGGHDDSLPYTAILCINNNPLCKCFNDGWGGDTELTPIDNRARAIMASANVTLSNYEWLYCGTKFKLDLGFIADTLAITESHNIELFK